MFILITSQSAIAGNSPLDARLFLECGKSKDIHIYIENWTDLDLNISSFDVLPISNIFKRVQIINNETYIKGGKTSDSYRLSLLKPIGKYSDLILDIKSELMGNERTRITIKDIASYYQLKANVDYSIYFNWSYNYTILNKKNPPQPSVVISKPISFKCW